LKEAIQSVINQTYRPIECIIIDDGSTDDTENLISGFKIYEDSTFLLNYIKQDNKGVQFARNKGTTIAEGEFIQYLDADDILYPDKIKNQVNYLNQNKEFDGVFGDWEKGSVHDKQLDIAYAGNDLITQFLTDKCIANFSFLMTKKIISKTGEWDIAIKRNQEIDFHIRAVLAGGKFNYHKELTGLWRIHNQIRIANSTGVKDIIFFYQKMESLLSNHRLFNKQLANKIASLHLWYVTQHIYLPNEQLYLMIKEALRLNENIAFNNFRFKLLSFIVGPKLTAYLWINRFRKNRRSN
jgi:glycosyltransferase involved in cell wall biosynthesis